MRDWQHIVWLASYPKSGNTWVRCFLDAYFIGEVDINDLVVSVSDDNAKRAHLGDGSDILKEHIDIAMMAKPMALLRLVAKYLDNQVPGVPLFVKTHTANLIVNGIAQVPYPVTRSAVYIIRDPRDVLPSFAEHMGNTLDGAIEGMLDVNRCLYGAPEGKMPEVLSSWNKHVLSWQQVDSFDVLFVRYEDLKEQPVRWFCKILEHAGVKPDTERVRRAVEAVKLSKLKAQEDEKGFREASDKSKGFFGRKHEKPDRRHYAKIENRCRTIMKQFGYLEKRMAA